MDRGRHERRRLRRRRCQCRRGRDGTDPARCCPLAADRQHPPRRDRSHPGPRSRQTKPPSTHRDGPSIMSSQHSIARHLLDAPSPTFYAQQLPCQVRLAEGWRRWPSPASRMPPQHGLLRPAEQRIRREASTSGSLCTGMRRRQLCSNLEQRAGRIRRHDPQAGKRRGQEVELLDDTFTTQQVFSIRGEPDLAAVWAQAPHSCEATRNGVPLSAIEQQVLRCCAAERAVLVTGAAVLTLAQTLAPAHTTCRGCSRGYSPADASSSGSTWARATPRASSRSTWPTGSPAPACSRPANDRSRPRPDRRARSRVRRRAGSRPRTHR